MNRTILCSLIATTTFTTLALLPHIASAGDSMFDPSITTWYPINPEESPGAKVQIELGEDDQNRQLVINYDFGEGGVYVGAEGGPIAPDAFKTIKFSAKSDTQAKLLLRVVDSTGEYFQIQFPDDMPGEWVEHDVSLDPAKFPLVFGGDGNEGIDFPIKSITLGVDKPGPQGNPAGTVIFQKLELTQ